MIKAKKKRVKKARKWCRLVKGKHPLTIAANDTHRLNLEMPEALPKASTKPPGYEADPYAFPPDAESFILYFHGAAESDSHPGPAAIGVMIVDPEGSVVYKLGDKITDDVSDPAAYQALNRGLAAAVELRVKKLEVRGDSEKVVRQVQGIWNVRAADMRHYNHYTKRHVKDIGQVAFRHIPVEQNHACVGLAKLAIEQGKVKPSGTLAGIIEQRKATATTAIQPTSFAEPTPVMPEVPEVMPKIPIEAKPKTKPTETELNEFKRNPDSYILTFDGASRGNPGPPAIGITIEDPQGNPVYKLGAKIIDVTSNVAEYMALIEGLRVAVELSIKSLEAVGDSRLIIRQMVGEAAGGFNVKDPKMKLYHEKAGDIVGEIGSVKFRWLGRGNNQECDTLAALALKCNKTEPLGTLKDIIEQRKAAATPQR